MKITILSLGIFLLTVNGSLMAKDFVKHDISTQPSCTLVNRAATRDCRWPAGLDMADYVVEKGRIIAYRIRWSNGSWSGWYVSGVNDIDGKFNIFGRTCEMDYKPNTMRRMWSYFFDHTHEFIICKPN